MGVTGCTWEGWASNGRYRVYLGRMGEECALRGVLGKDGRVMGVTGCT